MSTDIVKQPAAPPRSWRGDVEKSAASMLVSMVGEERAREAAGRVALAFDVARRAAKDPAALESCSPASVGACIAASALTQLYPGGPSPEVYLVPRQGALQWSLTHVGMGRLAARQGYHLSAVPVHIADRLVVRLGQVVEHEQDPRQSPASLADLQGVAVVLRRISDGVTLSTAWVPLGVIEARRKAKGAGPVWNQWPVEMALKTAIRYVYARGGLPLTGDDWRAAVAADAEPEVVDVVSAPTNARRALGLSAPVVEVEPEPEPATEEPTPEDTAAPGWEE